MKTRTKFDANDYIDKRYGRLVILEYLGTKYNKRLFNCLCDCGIIKAITLPELKNGSIVSCGCFHKEKVTKHGLSKTKTMKSWEAMISRCYNPSHVSFKRYGGRGIFVCEKWKDFNGFYEDMGIRPDGKTLDRIDNNDNYNALNCKWSSCKEQSRNRRDNKMLTINGELKCVAEWSDIFGINRQTIHERLKRNWDEQKAATFLPGGHILD